MDESKRTIPIKKYLKKNIENVVFAFLKSLV